jgi:hypothetical protein
MDTLTLSTRLLNEYGLPNQCQIEQATEAVRLRVGVKVAISGQRGRPVAAKAPKPAKGKA